MSDIAFWIGLGAVVIVALLISYFDSRWDDRFKRTQ